MKRYSSPRIERVLTNFYTHIFTGHISTGIPLTAWGSMAPRRGYLNANVNAMLIVMAHANRFSAQV